VTDTGPSAGIPLVLGLGNDQRGDDAVGLLVARRARPRLEGLATVLEVTTEGTELLDHWDGRDFVVAADAVRSGLAPGTVVRWESGAGPLRTPLAAVSSHAVSLGQAVALGEALGRLPAKLVLFGVEGVSFSVGSAPSPEVVAAVDPTARQIESEVRVHLASRSGRDVRGDSRA
jgi:hydrogenase maturation protease